MSRTANDCGTPAIDGTSAKETVRSAAATPLFMSSTAVAPPGSGLYQYWREGKAHESDHQPQGAKVVVSLEEKKDEPLKPA
jgi:hypothetical protein